MLSVFALGDQNFEWQVEQEIVRDNDELSVFGQPLLDRLEQRFVESPRRRQGKIRELRVEETTAGFVSGKERAQLGQPLP